MGLEALLTQLPLNRKERFYTGTVLPALVGAHDFAHVGRLFELAGLPSVEVSGDPADTRLLFFTEYGFKESLIGGSFGQFDPLSRDTPDVVLYLAPEGDDPGRLLGIEAKMFHRPSRAALEGQLAVQRQLLTGITDSLGLSEPTLIALLPHPLKEALGPLASPTAVITWEELATTFRDVAPAYWVAMLDTALERYSSLVGDQTSNAHAHLSGLEIVEGAAQNSFEYQHMGRQGGTKGKMLFEDFGPEGRWRGQIYQVRTTPLPGNPTNWFSIAEFCTRAEAWNTQHGT